jgi:hypothetical protein
MYFNFSSVQLKSFWVIFFQCSDVILLCVPPIPLSSLVKVVMLLLNVPSLLWSALQVLFSFSDFLFKIKFIPL